MADDDPKAGEVTTVNYGWTKPNVMGSDDAWGGLLNTDLDGIDSVVHGIQTSVPAASTTTPVMDGTAAAGAGTTWARGDHVHPTDTSRASVASVAALPVAMNDNRIINGDMRIDQRWNGASGSATSGYTVDRWGFGGSANKGAWGRITTAGLTPYGFGYALSFTSSSAYTPAASDTFYFYQAIEADMVSDFCWGTANASPVTLSFLFASSLNGTFSGSIANTAGTRSYPFTFSYPVAGGWQKIALTVPGDMTGTWVVNGNAASVVLYFNLGAGSTYRGPANAWASGNFTGATGAVNVVATNGATFYVTGVKLEIGSVATPYNRQSLAKSLADCQRYYCNLATISLSAGPPATAAGQQTYTFITLPTTMRAAPTVSVPTVSSTNCSAAGALNQAPTGFNLYITALAAGVFYGALGPITANAEL